MFELILLTLLLICYCFYRLYRFTKRQAAKEKTYWQDQKRFGKPIAYNLHHSQSFSYHRHHRRSNLYFHRTRLRRLPNLDRSNQPQISGNSPRSRHHFAPANRHRRDIQNSQVFQKMKSLKTLLIAYSAWLRSYYDLLIDEEI